MSLTLVLFVRNTHGEGGQVWEENRLHNVGDRTKEQLEAYYFTA